MPDFSQITPRIFIGDVYAAVGNYLTQEQDLLDTLNINTVISVLSEEEYDRFMVGPLDFPSREWHRFILEDDENEPIIATVHSVHRIITKSTSKNKNVLIHCAAGISRSPAILIGHLMLEKNISYKEAAAAVRGRRPIIQPNQGFVRQLKDFNFFSQQI
jgi:protein-tyrosine phosphatase